MAFGQFTEPRFKALCVVLERDEWTVDDFAEEADLSEKQSKMILDEFVDTDAMNYEEGKTSFGAGQERSKYHVNQVDMRRLISYQFRDLAYFDTYIQMNYNSPYFLWDMGRFRQQRMSSPPDVFSGVKVATMYEVDAWESFVERLVYAYDWSVCGKGSDPLPPEEW